MEGWALLDYLKHDVELRHIPVQILSGGDHPRRAFRMGAFSYIRKPAERERLVESVLKIKAFIDRRKKFLLIVEDHPAERENLLQLLAGDDLEVSTVGTGAEAIEVLKTRPYDAMILDLRLPDMEGEELIGRIQAEVGLLQLPIIVHTAKDLTEREEEMLSRVTSAIVVKDPMSPERLLQETALFLHRPAYDHTQPVERGLETDSHKDPALKGKTVLVVDDDMRNIYALTAVLEQSEMTVVFAQNGKKAIEELNSRPGIDVVLMDIMMPEMDGYTAMREIRKNEAFRELPMIALTAKAMKGDRERCIDAGASDYIPKPVDTERLLSLLRVWLYSER
jgi:hypothetical protein